MAKVRVQFDSVQTNGAGQRQSKPTQSAPESKFGLCGTQRTWPDMCACISVSVCVYECVTIILWPLSGCSGKPKP